MPGIMIDVSKATVLFILANKEIGPMGLLIESNCIVTNQN